MTLSSLARCVPDPLLHLLIQFREDRRDGKIDAGVGVFRNAAGETPVLRAVKRAEARLLREQRTKSYLGSAGDHRFVELMRDLVLADSLPPACVGGAQTPGGVGALRLAVELLADAGCPRILIGQPGWIAHPVICRRGGLRPCLFDSIDRSGAFDVERVLDAIRAAAPGEAILLQASCHNPTGSDPDAEQWGQIARALAACSVIPLLDIAYQGIGGGLNADAAGLRRIVGEVPYALIAASCDKNFGLYRDRTGALLLTTPDAVRTEALLSNVLNAARGNWSMPPDHGAAVVRLILDTPDLRRDWEGELDSMRRRLAGNRAALRGLGRVGAFDLDRLAFGTGMFCRLPLSADQMKHLRVHDGIYVAPGGRLNLGGLSTEDLPRLAAALAALDRDTLALA